MTYHTHGELNQMFKDICDIHPEWCSYNSVGKTFKNNDIWLFKIGNPNGGRVLIESCLHGWEDMGAEVSYLFVKWLLESGDSHATQLLNTVYYMFIPVVNFDSQFERGNQNFVECPVYGVDLNRNFVRGWNRASCGNGPYSTSTGASAASEPETQTIKSVFSQYNPDIFVDLHYGGGARWTYHGPNTSTFWLPVRTRIMELWTEYGIWPEQVNLSEFLSPNSSGSGSSMAVSDAYTLGIEPFLVEFRRANNKDGDPGDTPEEAGPCPWIREEGYGSYGRNPPYALVESCLALFGRASFVAMGESVAIPYNPPDPGDIDDTQTFTIQAV